MIELLKLKWCDWFHAGGIIKRDSANRINWQCETCGRWAIPVSLEDEKAFINS